MIILIDNYDSFVYNLDRYLRRLGQQTLVVRSDAISADSIERLNCSAIVISPGPKTPDDAGCSLEVIRRLSHRLPILGVCLGHQAIGQAFGGRLIRAIQPVHGKASLIQRTGESRLLSSLPQEFKAGRYHSLVVDAEKVPECLQVTAKSVEGQIMAIEHKTRNVFGVQFHPESILSDCGYAILASFLELANLPRPAILPNSDLATKSITNSDGSIQRD
jgi:anthranilate synthase/aminodeoxychorismate synthase-like glutamine amidotransferase